VWNYLENPRPLFRAFTFLSRTIATQTAELARVDADEYLRRMAEELAGQDD
jgi:hypothetical protein